MSVHHVFLKYVRPGDAIAVEHFKVIYEHMRRCRLSVSQGCGITMDSGPGGIALSLTTAQGFWIKLTSNSGNNFAWIEQLPQAGGTWADGYMSGTTSNDAAHEINGAASTPTLPVKVWAWRGAASGEVLFRLGAC